MVAVDRRHREWLGGTEAQSQTSTRPEARGLGGFRKNLMGFTHWEGPPEIIIMIP